MPLTPRPGPMPATYWADKVTKGRMHERIALGCAKYVSEQPTDPCDLYAGELRRSRYRAALAEADAWATYSRECEAAFQDAALHEMEEADAREALHAANRSRYDAPQDAA